MSNERINCQLREWFIINLCDYHSFDLLRFDIKGLDPSAPQDEDGIKKASEECEFTGFSTVWWSEIM